MTALASKRRRIAWSLAAVTACAAALAAAAPAGASKPRLSAADRNAINATLDVFVNSAVKRKDVPASYDVVTAALRGGMSRRQWSRGSIPVYPYPARGYRFHEWTIDYITREEVALQLLLFPRRGSKLGPFVFKVYLTPAHRRWLVDSFMPAATFAPVNGPSKVTAVTDFMPQPKGDSSLPTGSARVSYVYAFVPFALMGLILAAVLAWVVAGKLRDRRFAGPRGRSLPPLPGRYSGS